MRSVKRVYAGTAAFIACLVMVFGVYNCCFSMKAKLDNYIKKWVDVKHFSGSVLVAQKGKIILSKGYGMANYEHNVPNTPQTKFHIGSVSKQFASMAIMILVKQGKLKLEDTVATILPDYPGGEKITVYQLLTHTSGLPNYTDFPDFDEKMGKSTSIAELINRFKDKPLEFNPGSEYKYCNSGYVLLGAIVEKLSGQSYEQFLRENIFKPVHMDNSGFLDSKKLIMNRARGYSLVGEDINHVPDNSFVGGERQNSQYCDLSTIIVTGGLYSTVEDMYRWDRALYKELLLPKNLSAKLWKPYLKDYGLGWKIQKLHEKNTVWHSGEFCDCIAGIFRFIDDDVCIIILGNISVFSIGDTTGGIVVVSMAKDIAAILFGQKPEGTPKKHVEIAVNPEIYDQYVGTYKAKQADINFVVTKEKGKLFVESDKIELINKQYKFEVYPEAENKFFYKVVEMQITFEKDKDGKVTKLVLHQGGENISADKFVDK